MDVIQRSIGKQCFSAAYNLHLDQKGTFEVSVKMMSNASATAHGGLFRLIIAALAIPLRPRRQFLDIRTLPDHLKRDMGFMDGNDPAGRHL